MRQFSYWNSHGWHGYPTGNLHIFRPRESNSSIQNWGYWKSGAQPRRCRDCVPVACCWCICNTLGGDISSPGPPLPGESPAWRRRHQWPLWGMPESTGPWGIDHSSLDATLAGILAEAHERSLGLSCHAGGLGRCRTRLPAGFCQWVARQSLETLPTSSCQFRPAEICGACASQFRWFLAWGAHTTCNGGGGARLWLSGLAAPHRTLPPGTTAGFLAGISVECGSANWETSQRSVWKQLAWLHRLGPNGRGRGPTIPQVEPGTSMTECLCTQSLPLLPIVIAYAKVVCPTESGRFVGWHSNFNGDATGWGNVLRAVVAYGSDSQVKALTGLGGSEVPESWVP